MPFPGEVCLAGKQAGWYDNPTLWLRVESFSTLADLPTAFPDKTLDTVETE
jgi:hypothetical protein